VFMAENIEYLYHYTNIESLALILKNRTIRFNSLDKMDDLQEKETADIKNIGQFCYISSWTDNPTESIPMWNMYASLNLGVRIKLRKNPFVIYDNTAEEISRIMKASVADNSKGQQMKTLIPISTMLKDGFISAQALSRQILYKVEYTNDVEKLYPHMLKIDGKQLELKFDNLGKHKNLHWKFQREWRYKLDILPFNININQPTEELIDGNSKTLNRIIHGTEMQLFPYYDMIISNEAFEDMEITLSPRIGGGSNLIVQTLVEKYNPSATITESSLVGFI
ncbi:MAG: DUF2971 domain-containing protein, partial [Clostridiales bacterium]|nr:DUF2971 domain-containing protein [Clostridiales bacterium]